MLDFFRNHKRLMMFMLLLVVLPGLGFVGIQGFRGFFDESANVASVNGHKITRAEYDNAARQQLDQARQVMGAQFDASMFDTPQHRKDILDGLIQQRVLVDETQRLHLTASDDAVRRALLSDPVISSLKKGGSVTLVGFGTFAVGKRTARTGRNPRTGDAIKIKAAKVPKFRPGKALKDALN